VERGTEDAEDATGTTEVNVLKKGIWYFAIASMAACGGTPGAQPHDMSAAQHEAMAANESKAGESHAAQYSPDASVASERCDPRSTACWTSTTNPTATHLDDANKHRKAAADHRAASQALRDAEASACVGLSDNDRDMSPFDHREDIASVQPLNLNVSSGRGQYMRMEGAVITFRAVPGMTAQWLQRVVDCHLARNAALGHDVPEMPYCPLVPKGVTAKVTATDSGFAVAVRSEDSDTSKDVLRRAQALVAQ
jgi:hypothetical protein